MSPRRPGSHIVDTEEALEEIRAGRMIILMDDEDRENEGDLCVAADIVTPGHVFPLRARRGGVLVRTGQTEGAVDLARLAGFAPAGVICEVMREDGAMARLPDLEAFAEEHGLKIATIADLIGYRSRHDSLVHRAAESHITTRYGGEFRAFVYTTDIDDPEHLALVKGDIRPDEPLLVRPHLEYLPGAVFGY